jgi:hypothetical protein
MRRRVERAWKAVRRGGLCLTAGIFWLIPAVGMTLVAGIVLVPLTAILLLAGVPDDWIRRMVIGLAIIWGVGLIGAEVGGMEAENTREIQRRHGV